MTPRPIPALAQEAGQLAAALAQAAKEATRRADPLCTLVDSLVALLGPERAGQLAPELLRQVPPDALPADLIIEVLGEARAGQLAQEMLQRMALPTLPPLLTPANGKLLGERMRARREVFGWTRSTLAQRSKMSASTIKNVELGRHQPNFDTLQRLLLSLGLTLQGALQPETPEVLPQETDGICRDARTQDGSRGEEAVRSELLAANAALDRALDKMAALRLEAERLRAGLPAQGTDGAGARVQAVLQSYAAPGVRVSEPEAGVYVTGRPVRPAREE